MTRFILPLLFAVTSVAFEASAAESLGTEVARVAQHYRDARPTLRMDTCNGLIQDVMRDAGHEIRGGVRMLHAKMKELGWVHHHKVPEVGDIVFFDKTYDSNHNGRQDDKLSHVAVVITIDADDTVHMVHHGSKGIRPLTLNLRMPGTRRNEEGKAVNSWLGKPGYAKEGFKLAGELFSDFATPNWPDGRAPDVRDSPLLRLAKRTHKDHPPRSIESSSSIQKLPVAIDDLALVRLWNGQNVRERNLDGRTCRQLWFLRNAIFARHGYNFRSPDALAAFDLVPGWRANPKVRQSTVGELLTRRDEHTLDLIIQRENRCR
jgi:hypothetical protein